MDCVRDEVQIVLVEQMFAKTNYFFGLGDFGL